jgi:hypothetical protein
MVVLAPELLVSLAMGDWRAATAGQAIMAEHGGRGVEKWTKKHAHFANMGGISFRMLKGGEYIPDSAPFWDHQGRVTLGKIRDQFSQSTTRVVYKSARAMLLLAFEILNSIWKCVVERVSHFLECMRALVVSLYTAIWSLVWLRRRRNTVFGGMIELDPFDLQDTNSDDAGSLATSDPDHPQEVQSQIDGREPVSLDLSQQPRTGDPGPSSTRPPPLDSQSQGGSPGSTSQSPREQQTLRLRLNSY